MGETWKEEEEEETRAMPKKRVEKRTKQQDARLLTGRERLAPSRDYQFGITRSHSPFLNSLPGPRDVDAKDAKCGLSVVEKESSGFEVSSDVAAAGVPRRGSR